MAAGGRQAMVGGLVKLPVLLSLCLSPSQAFSFPPLTLQKPQVSANPITPLACSLSLSFPPHNFPSPPHKPPNLINPNTPTGAQLAAPNGLGDC